MTFLDPYCTHPGNAIPMNFKSKKCNEGCVSLNTRKAEGIIPALHIVL
jgi:hypothetical protein